MNRNNLLMAIVVTGTIAASPVLGQRPAAPTTRQLAATQTNAAVPESKIALIYSDDFRDAKTGIVRYNALMDVLAKEFQPAQDALNQLAQKIQQLSDEIDRTKNVAAPEAIRQKGNQLEQMKTDYKRKGEDGQAAYKKRRDEVFAPLDQEIFKALEAYAKARGITVIIDGNQVPLVYVAEAVDITRAFINEFNSKNPATASSTPRE